ncbi:hypothetical protein [Robinsoniella peoriensis]|uniref:hypothetical protein n=1 Tax=Robinsoniella peoriensis TaxID=180332 RepID=UPI003753C9B2
MNYTSEIFDRLNIQHIREFLLHGVACCEISDKGYEDRIDELQKVAIGSVERGFPDTREREAVVSQIFNYADAVESVYMEIGMKCGVALAVQFLNANKVK